MPKDEGESIKELIMKRGVQIPCPQSVEIGNDIDPDRISGEGVVIHAGSKIYGGSTLILSGTIIGYEGPATILDCHIGPEVKLGGGFFEKAVFLKGAKMGSGSFVREGTILEEEASAAHTVGLKQTILFPYVTLGSLINFCDCFMAGGTSRKDHSEVGSSYIHFNYTPNQDKATPSLLGDVPLGVMLNQSPIFLGGQGGLVGPCRLGYGTVIAAGSIFRKDELRTGRLVFEGRPRGGNLPHLKGVYKSVKRILMNNLFYIANLKALLQWYDHIRRLFISDNFPETLLMGLIETLKLNTDERIRQLRQMILKLPESAEKFLEMVKTDDALLIRQKYELFENWPALEAVLNEPPDTFEQADSRNNFMEQMEGSISKWGCDYLSTIQNLPAEAAQQGSHWLRGIIEGLMSECLKQVPAFI